MNIAVITETLLCLVCGLGIAILLVSLVVESIFQITEGFVRKGVLRWRVKDAGSPEGNRESPRTSFDHHASQGGPDVGSGVSATPLCHSAATSKELKSKIVSNVTCE